MDYNDIIKQTICKAESLLDLAQGQRGTSATLGIERLHVFEFCKNSTIEMILYVVLNY